MNPPNLKIIDGKLIYEIPTELQIDGALFLCYVLRYGKVHYKQQSWSNELFFEYDILESGMYAIQLHANIQSVKSIHYSEPIRHITTLDKQNYNDFITGKIDLPPTLDNQIFDYPYQRIVVIFRPKNDLKNKSQYLNFQSYNFDGKSEIFILGDFIKKDENSIYLSGSYIEDGKLIFGSEDLKQKKSVPKGCLGNYTCLTVNEDGTVEFSSDYFGISKIYAYKYNGTFVASNSYRSLIDALVMIEEDLTIDKERVASNFVFLTLQPFHQLYTKYLDIKNTFVLLPTEKLIIHNGVASLDQSPIKCDISKIDDVKKDYPNLLNQGINEVKNNVKACLEHPRFQSVLVDLTGGMDSRMVFAAATNFPEFKNKIKIHTRFSKAEPRDSDIALSLNTIYDFEFDSLNPPKTSTRGQNFWSESINHNLGVYYSYRPNVMQQKLPQSLRLVGFYGEICARPYYSRPHLNTVRDTSSTNMFVKLYFESHQHLAISGKGSSALNELKVEFQRQLEECPGSSALEKLEFHYLFFRNGLHCSDAGRIGFSCPEFGPIQSKSLFLAKHTFFQNHKSIKLQLDALEKLNPLLASHEYESENDNKEKQRLKNINQLEFENIVFKDAVLKTNFDSTKWDTANALKKDSVLDIPKLSEFNDFYRNQTRFRDKYSLAMLNSLINKNLIDVDGLGMDLWLALTKNSIATDSDSAAWNLFNRISSLFFQYKLISLN